MLIKLTIQPLVKLVLGIRTYQFLIALGIIIIMTASGCKKNSNTATPEQMLLLTATPTNSDQPILRPTPTIGISVDRFVELQRFEQDDLNGYDVSPDGTMLAIARSTGIHTYDLIAMSYVNYWEIDKFVQSITWSPDHKYLATRHSDDTLIIWDATLGQNLRTIDLASISPSPGSTAIKAPISWSPDGTQLFAAGVIWNTDSWVPEFQTPGAVSGILWSPDNNLLSTNTWVDWSVWTKAGEELICPVRLPFEVAWSPNGDLVTGNLVSTTGDAITIWDPVTGEILYKSEYLIYESITDVAWSPGGLSLAFGVTGHKLEDMIRILDLSSGEIIHEFEIQISYSDMYGRGLKVVWSQDGSKIATGHGDGFIRVWDIYTEELVYEFQAHSSSVREIHWTQPEKMLTAGGGIYTGGGDIRIWDISSGEMLENISGNILIPELSWSEDGSHIMVGTNRAAYTWDIEAGQISQELFNYGDAVIAIARPADADMIAYSEQLSDKVRVWSFATGEAEYDLGGGYQINFALSPVKNWLAVAGFQRFRIWDIDSGQGLVQLGNDCHVSSLAWSFDGKLLAYGDVWGMIRIFDPAADDVIQIIQIHDGYVNGLAWSPDGEFIAASDHHSYTGSNRIVQVYNVTTGKFAFGFDGGEHITWSPDGKWIATTISDDYSIKLWNVDNLEETYMLDGHQGRIIDIKWSPDGLKLASISVDGTLRIWGIPSR